MTLNTTASATSAAKCAALPRRERNTASTVIPFVMGAGRRFRRETDDAPRGQILLFTGVRYERLPEVEAPPVPKRRRS